MTSITNDNARNYICIACGATVDVAYAQSVTTGERIVASDDVVAAMLLNDGWWQVGNDWLCHKHRFPVLI